MTGKRDARIQGSHSRGKGVYTGFGKVKQKAKAKPKAAKKKPAKKTFGKRGIKFV